MIDKIGYITKYEAVNLVNTFHYSKVLPKLNKYFIGGYHNNELVAVCTLGWGVRPQHTIDIMFPGLRTKNYFEIGKLCVSEEMPKNTESNFIAKIIKELKRPDSAVRIDNPELKVLYSWADGIIGKPGYVYQASNFYYGGYIWTKMLLTEDNHRVHKRTAQGMTGVSINPEDRRFEKRYSDKSKGQRMKFSTSFDALKQAGLRRIDGLQFRYVFPICSKKEWKRLQKISPFKWTRGNYPKDDDCKWKERNKDGKWVECDLPNGIKTEYDFEKKVKSFNDFFSMKGIL